MNDSKYTLLELMFSDRWQWVRRISGMFWVKSKEPGYVWVKFSKEELSKFDEIEFSFNNDKLFITEDWRKE